MAQQYPEILIIGTSGGLIHSSWKEVKRMPKKGKKEHKGKPEKWAEKAGKGADRGLHKGWAVAKGAAKDVGKHVEEAACETEEPKEEEKED